MKHLLHELSLRITNKHKLDTLKHRFTGYELLDKMLDLYSMQLDNKYYDRKWITGSPYGLDKYMIGCDNLDTRDRVCAFDKECTDNCAGYIDWEMKMNDIFDGCI